MERELNAILDLWMHISCIVFLLLLVKCFSQKYFYVYRFKCREVLGIFDMPHDHDEIVNTVEKALYSFD